ncbi:CRISPR-associated helicase/endonuclease Cas3 [Fusobacterium varium]|uniref:CRISPR-associated helicase/endonuclease Cas3 n=1 Tax=Fusobacterium varium ATCC 27725 TaxID=469618 RepID=A0ABM6U6C6_FUSVA|nr:CRISPR-associated helicase/endonuclease Cas3 [Fusobacterium varium]AVQ31953.1 CRISPR-associated helicase/endonuclease Cas3 [Fusobacterium varium ATCC 27725]EES63310.1 CRISPR-associated helicase Cas3 [Fusobacterium varium ATCC 27725]
MFEEELFSIEKYVKDENKVLAHISDIKNPETLLEHSDLVIKYFKKIYEDKNLKIIFDKLADKFWRENESTKKFWNEMIVNTIYMHDIGKLNINFQIDKMKNKIFDRKHLYQSKRHSNLSARIYIDHFGNKVFKLYSEKKLDNKTALKCFIFIILNSYIISRHHSSTKSLSEDFFNEIIKDYEEYKELFEEVNNYCPNLNFLIKESKNLFRILKQLKIGEKEWNNSIETKDWESVDYYIYTKLLYSLLVSSDFYATSEYSSGKPIESLNLLTNIDEYISVFNNTDIYKGIKLHQKTGKIFSKDNINYYRSEMFLEAEQNLGKNIKENILFLEAPTGSGKTITSINLALKLLEKNRELNKIFYIFPFNTLVEQTNASLREIFQGSFLEENISVINSITPIKEVENEDGRAQIDYERSLLNRQFIHSPIVLTTHVHFFENLFGIDRESSFALPHLANSVVIMDEIQSYKNKIWKEIIIFLKKYAEILNIKIIIMSATLPNLSFLLNSEAQIPSLVINKEKYYRNPIFKDRVSLDFSLLEKEYEKEELFDQIEKIILEKYRDKKVVVEFIKKSSAFDFYKRLVEKNEDSKEDIFLITGDDNKAERKKIIKEAKDKKRKSMILVATQVIEAGVDIDMDIGFKNISILDADEQFLGRINRSCKKKNCKVYFFKLDDGGKIYKSDVRIQGRFTLMNEEMREILKSKNFSEYYSKILEVLDDFSNKEDEENIENFRRNKVVQLNFEEINKRLKLITDEMKTKMIFFSRNIKIEGEEIEGNKVWKEFKEVFLNNEIGYAERRVKLSKVMEKVDLFSYNIPKEMTYRLSYQDSIGDNILYIQDGEEYFVNGKFDRKKMQSKNDCEMIL